MELGRIISPDAVRAALALARREFDRSVVCEERGRAEFYRFTEFTSITGLMLAGDYKMWGVRDRELRGVGALRGDGHVSMLFVEDEYRGHGIGRVLCETMVDEARQAKASAVTVNADPAAVGFYTRMGFDALGTEQQRNGISFVPMTLTL